MFFWKFCCFWKGTFFVVLFWKKKKKKRIAFSCIFVLNHPFNPLLYLFIIIPLSLPPPLSPLTSPFLLCFSVFLVLIFFWWSCCMLFLVLSLLYMSFFVVDILVFDILLYCVAVVIYINLGGKYYFLFAFLLVCLCIFILKFCNLDGACARSSFLFVWKMALVLEKKILGCFICCLIRKCTFFLLAVAYFLENESFVCFLLLLVVVYILPFPESVFCFFLLLI